MNHLVHNGQTAVILYSNSIHYDILMCSILLFGRRILNLQFHYAASYRILWAALRLPTTYALYTQRIGQDAYILLKAIGYNYAPSIYERRCAVIDADTR